MKATIKQCDYLNGLKARVNAIYERYPALGPNMSPQWDWRGEVERGMTAKDASERITAYHSLIIGLRLKADLLGLT